jgi:hypothetical protein
MDFQIFFPCNLPGGQLYINRVNRAIKLRRAGGGARSNTFSVLMTLKRQVGAAHGRDARPNANEYRKAVVHLNKEEI